MMTLSRVAEYRYFSFTYFYGGKAYFGLAERGNA